MYTLFRHITNRTYLGVRTEGRCKMNDESLEIYLEDWKHTAASPTPEAVDRLCEVYLSATPPQQKLIRALFSEDALFHRVFDSYTQRVYEKMQSTKEVRWLYNGLVVHSLEDNRVDWRDVLVALSDLWLHAEKSGINPSSIFREVAAMSSATALYDYHSMQGLMASIETSACLAEMRR